MAHHKRNKVAVRRRLEWEKHKGILPSPQTPPQPKNKPDYGAWHFTKLYLQSKGFRKAKTWLTDPAPTLFSKLFSSLPTELLLHLITYLPPTTMYALKLALYPRLEIWWATNCLAITSSFLKRTCSPSNFVYIGSVRDSPHRNWIYEAYTLSTSSLATQKPSRDSRKGYQISGFRPEKSGAPSLERAGENVMWWLARFYRRHVKMVHLGGEKDVEGFLGNAERVLGCLLNCERGVCVKGWAKWISIMLEGRGFAQFARPGPCPSTHSKLLLTVDDFAFLIKEFTLWVFCLAVKGIKKANSLWMNTAELWEEEEKHQDHCFDLFFEQGHLIVEHLDLFKAVDIMARMESPGYVRKLLTNLTGTRYCRHQILAVPSSY